MNESLDKRTHPSFSFFFFFLGGGLSFFGPSSLAAFETFGLRFFFFPEQARTSHESEIMSLRQCHYLCQRLVSVVAESRGSWSVFAGIYLAGWRLRKANQVLLLKGTTGNKEMKVPVWHGRALWNQHVAVVLNSVQPDMNHCQRFLLSGMAVTRINETLKKHRPYSQPGVHNLAEQNQATRSPSTNGSNCMARLLVLYFMNLHSSQVLALHACERRLTRKRTVL